MTGRRAFLAVPNSECLPGFGPRSLVGSSAFWEPVPMVREAAALGSFLHTLGVIHVPGLLTPLARNEQRTCVGEAAAESPAFTFLHFLLHFPSSKSQLIVLELSKWYIMSSPYKLLVFRKMLYIIMILLPQKGKMCIKQKLS